MIIIAIIVLIVFEVLALLFIYLLWIKNNAKSMNMDDDSRQITERMIDESSSVCFNDNLVDPGQI